MSVSKWAYSPEKCDGQPCVGECDMCRLSEVEADGFITREEDLIRTAKPLKECIYPKCEDCDSYDGEFCTIPIIVTKQLLLDLDARLTTLTEALDGLINAVYGEILGGDGDFVPDGEQS